MGKLLFLVAASLPLLLYEGPRKNSSKGGSGDTPEVSTPTRIVTWNVENQTKEISSSAQDKFYRILTELDADVLALQEMRDAQSVAAIMQGVRGEFIGIIDQNDSPRNLGFVIRTDRGVRFVSHPGQPNTSDLRIDAEKSNITVYDADKSYFLFPDDNDLDDDDEDIISHEEYFPEFRDLLFVRLQIPGCDRDVIVINTHAKSRRGGRARTDSRRVGAAQMAVDAIQARFPDCYVVFVGDFNDTPDCRSLQILETGGHDAQPQLGDSSGEFLFNLTQHLADENHVSLGLSLSDTHENRLITITPGSQLRDFTHTGTQAHTGDQLFDQILVSSALRNHFSLGDVWVCDMPAVLGKDVSDHQPVVAVFSPRPSDQPIPVTTGDPNMRIQAPAHEPASSTADNDLQQARQTLGRLQPRPDQINAVPGSVQITKILPNPEGSNEGGREWVEITNTTQEPVNIFLWVIEDKAGHKTTITPDDGTEYWLQPGERGTQRIFLQGSGSAVLNNKNGDDVILKAHESGEPIHEVFYTGANEDDILELQPGDSGLMR